jgi:hypothetical protein
LLGGTGEVIRRVQNRRVIVLYLRDRLGKVLDRVAYPLSP